MGIVERFFRRKERGGTVYTTTSSEICRVAQKTLNDILAREGLIEEVATSHADPVIFSTRGTEGAFLAWGDGQVTLKNGRRFLSFIPIEMSQDGSPAIRTYPEVTSDNTSCA